MKRLMERIKSDAEKRNITNIEIAKKLNVSKSQVSHYFNDNNRISFEKFLDLILLIYDEWDEELISRYCKVTDKPEHDREALEWCMLNSKHDLALFLIEKIKLKKDKKEQNLAGLYELLLRRYKGEFTPQQFLEELENIKVKGNMRKESIVFINILSVYGHGDFKNYKAVHFFAELAMKELRGIKNQFIKNAYEIRVNDCLAFSFKNMGHLKEAEDICLKCITEGNERYYPVVVNSMYCLLSEIYMFNNYEKSLHYINYALRMTEKENMKMYKKRKSDLESTHDFIKIVNRDYNGLFLNDPEEKAHYLARLGTTKSRREALHILSEIEKKNGGLSNFQKFYKALALNDKELMLEVYKGFLIQGVIYYSALPYKEIFE